MVFKNLHRFSGIIVSVFVVAHLFNHTMAWFGIATHQQILEFLRIVYQQPVVEIILIGCFLFQAYSGVILIVQLRNKEEKSSYEKLQIYSGVVLGLFIIQHISATIGQRIYYQFDTNFYFASRVVLQYPINLFFVPYYFLGILSFALHIANVHRLKIMKAVGQKQAQTHFTIILSLFILVAILILFVFMGGKYAIVIPNQYQVY
ncbi:hypothetical protein LV89_01350 [Arcicella aurantiaca]|uniref:Succinate dehydrogenase / fumarate reductase cytochrome b subunit n=1 Tax=Arcicella aurantiaca TaxID=591202 RepID=A0A316EF33_9BACT|nr:hypothetical protein [Arcicella aurantiaca]PWK27943.1 hypothetical protein LV89_01350 [Arcicella aurantiaca]